MQTFDCLKLRYEQAQRMCRIAAYGVGFHWERPLIHDWYERRLAFWRERSHEAFSDMLERDAVAAMLEWEKAAVMCLLSL